MIFLRLLSLLIQVSLALPISASPVSDLNFGLLSPGDTPATIPPGSSDGPGNASIQVHGDPSSLYTIVLPASINMITGSGGATEAIQVSSFLSNPSAHGSGVLDSTGNQVVLIGATRSATLLNQSPGVYSAVFTVTVIQ